MSDMEEEEGGIYIPLKQRKLMEQEKLRNRRVLSSSVSSNLPSQDTSMPPPPAPASTSAAVPKAPISQTTIDRSKMSLVDQVRLSGLVMKTEEERQRELEEDILHQVLLQQKASLASAKETASGVVYTESLKTDWQPPKYYRNLSSEEMMKIRKDNHIMAEGDDIPPPITTFDEMRLPIPILKALKDKGIFEPSPIQIQGIPAALSGRDMIGIAFTGSGKTVAFTIPLLCFCIQEELRKPLTGNEGPFGLIIAPSRELARQHEVGVKYFSKYINEYYFGGSGEGNDNTRSSSRGGLRSMLAIGGEDIQPGLQQHQRMGTHILAGTPGRIMDLLKRRKIRLDYCRYIVLDEGDRMLDVGFDEEVKEIFSYFTKQRQTLIYSATMPKKVTEFAIHSLVRPIIINASRAGAASLQIEQQVEHVPDPSHRIKQILISLQKTAPPVLVFAENKRDVDEIHEYLLIKGVHAVAIHGDKTQAERSKAVDDFQSGAADVLVATDVAAKGMDFRPILHVINFDLPREIENYVHRIGRTGRGGNKGIATTYITTTDDPKLLMDLRSLLVEADQKVPQFLAEINEDSDRVAGSSTNGCAYCGGLGHRITECPKLLRERVKLSGQQKDALGTSGGDW